MTLVCLNITNAEFLYTDLKISAYFVCLQIKYLWTEIRNLDGIPDFGQMENDILVSMFA